MAIIAKDLYPAPSWNFAFGMASYEKRTGVSSLFRYFNETADTSKALDRLTHTSAHEIGHMLSMHHCLYALCIMNGSNSLEESDKQPNRLCSECHRKLQYNLKFDISKRLNSLNAYFRQHQVTAASLLIQKDMETLAK